MQALCTALIGNTTSPFSLDPNNFLGGRGDGVILQLSSGNRALRSEEGKTWTLGMVLRSPFEHPLVSGATLAIDWYKVEDHRRDLDDHGPVDAMTCASTAMARATRPTRSTIRTASAATSSATRPTARPQAGELDQYQNLGIIDTSGIDINLNWRAALADMGLASLPGALSLNVSFTKLFEFKAQEFVSWLDAGERQDAGAWRPVRLAHGDHGALLDTVAGTWA